MMKIFEYNEAKQVVVCGDIHGAFETMVFKTCVQYGMTDTLVIVAGDCGFGFERPNHYINLYNGLAGRLKKANNWIVFVRGNHDDPSYFQEEKICYERFRCVPDYSVIQACGLDILCVGGGVSIDRLPRQRDDARYIRKETASRSRPVCTSASGAAKGHFHIPKRYRMSCVGFMVNDKGKCGERICRIYCEEDQGEPSSDCACAVE